VGQSAVEHGFTGRQVFDVTGAGDTVLSVLALAVAAGAELRDAAVLANAAAGVVVGKLGTASVTAEELSAALAESR
jgi:bifunctional ADP-heptose synthase (sugar kinase/adenylyltransferase)